MKRSILAYFSTENLTFRRALGQTYEIIGMVGTDNTIISEDTLIPIQLDGFLNEIVQWNYRVFNDC